MVMVWEVMVIVNFPVGGKDMVDAIPIRKPVTELKTLLRKQRDGVLRAQLQRALRTQVDGFSYISLELDLKL